MNEMTSRQKNACRNGNWTKERTNESKWMDEI